MPEHFGIRITSAEKDKLVGEIDVDHRHLNKGGIVHGGALLAFADDLGGTVAGLNIPEGFRTTTIESKSNIFHSCPPGHAMIDHGRRHPDAAQRVAAQRRADLLIPVVKAWCTELGVAVASTGIQVHGGMGYVEETGAAQYLRDARIGPIYEGTNGIQANDLVGRKLSRDHGEAAGALVAEMRETGAALKHSSSADLAAVAKAFDQGLAALETATSYLVEAESAEAMAGSVPYLTLLGTVSAGWLMARQAVAAEARLAANAENAAFLAAKLVTARFYAEHFLALAPGYVPGVMGGSTVLGFDPSQF